MRKSTNQVVIFLFSQINYNLLKSYVTKPPIKKSIG